MEEAAELAALHHYIDAPDQDVAHEIYHDDAVLEFPQSGERFDGVESFKAWRRMYPAKVDYELRDFRGGGDVWVAELVLRYDGGPPSYGVSILQFRGDKVARETIYVAEGWEAPEWRAAYASKSSTTAGVSGTDWQASTKPSSTSSSSSA